MSRIPPFLVISITVLAAMPRAAFSVSGTEGASFLDIPVGGAPAALGGAYSAQATDAYAPVWNPAGLGSLHSLEFTGMHLSYLGPLHYEHAGVVVPIGKESDNDSGPAGFGAAIQYLGSGNLDARNDLGESEGTFTSAFAAYTLAYGQRLDDTLSVGGSAKFITEKISDADAKGYAADFGLMYKPNAQWNFGAVLANVGPDIKFVNEADALPMAGRLGALCQLAPTWDLSAEAVYRRSGLASGSLGLEWRYGDMFSFRGGFNTSRIKELGAIAGVTGGLGLFFWGQELSYAWVPVGDLGQTHYFSLVFRTNTGARPEKPRLKKAAKREEDDLKSTTPESYHNIFDFLNENEKQQIQ